MCPPNPASKHPLHRAVERLLMETIHDPSRGIRVLCDSACQVGEPRGQHLPLFTDASVETQDLYCKVDLLVLRQNEVRVVLEVDETGYSPTKICGKFLATALSKRFKHPRWAPDPFPLASHTQFVQVIPRSVKQSPRSRKPAQVKSLEKSIKAVLPLCGSTVTEYWLLSGNTDDFRVGHAQGQELIEHVGRALGQRT